MATHEFVVEPHRENFAADPGAGLIRVRDPLGRSFALPFGTEPERGNCLSLRIGVHALCARQLYALAALLENQQRAVTTGSAYVNAVHPTATPEPAREP